MNAQKKSGLKTAFNLKEYELISQILETNI